MSRMIRLRSAFPRFALSILVLTLFALHATALSAWSARWYVDSAIPVSGNGASWSDAFQTIHESIAVAGPNDHIWIKKGTYDQVEAIAPSVPLFIYGGFAGHESHPRQRNLASGLSIVNCKESALGVHATRHLYLDGLVIQNGTEPVSYPYHGGGGLIVENARLVLKNCEINDTEGSIGLKATNSVLALSGCTLRKNAPAYPSGGGAIETDNCSITIYKSKIINNSRTAASVVWLKNTAGNIVDSEIIDNGTRFSGGAIQNDATKLLKVSGCTFKGNSVASGASSALSGGKAHVSNCLFYNNSCITDVVSLTNSALINCIFAYNQVDQQYICYLQNSIVVNCTFTRNQGEVMVNGNGATAVYNSIIWGNDYLYSTPASVQGAAVRYSNIEGGHPGLGNIDADPLFVDPVNYDFHLSLGSPCINKARVAVPFFPPRDFEGDRRWIGRRPDMGADEFRP